MRKIGTVLLLLLSFRLGMTVKEAQANCPSPLIPVYKMLRADNYLGCDDGRNTTILVFSSKTNRLSAIMDIKYFITIPGF